MPDVNYKQLYEELLDDARSLASTFRSLQLAASYREAPAYEDAYEMTTDVLAAAQKRETPMSEKLDFYGEASPIPKGCSVGFTKEDGIVKVTVNLEKLTLDHLGRAFVEVSMMKVDFDNKEKEQDNE